MTTLYSVGIIWGIFTAALIILLIYRSTLTMGKDEQLFLDDASSHMHDEQTELLKKVNRLRVPVWVFGGGSSLFLLNHGGHVDLSNTQRSSVARQFANLPRNLAIRRIL